MIILDTHVWFRLLVKNKKFKPADLKLIQDAIKSSSFGISAITIWEISMLAAHGRIQLQLPVKQWISQALSFPGSELIPLTPEIAVESCELPGDFHGDPADRILVATARILGATLWTSDRKILEYAKKGHMKTHRV